MTRKTGAGWSASTIAAVLALVIGSADGQEICDGKDNDGDGRIDEGFDHDLDGIADCRDDCPSSFNPSQADTDGDRAGDACDTGGEFVRGETNADGSVNIADALRILGHLFLGLPGPTCEDAWDANDSSNVDLSDSLTILNFLFSGTARIPAPHPLPGLDPTDDALSCGWGRLDPRAFRSVARVQLDLDSGPNGLRVALRGQGAGATGGGGGTPELTSELEGSIRLRLTPTDPVGLSPRVQVELEGLWLQAATMAVGAAKTGAISFARSHGAPAQGEFDAATGAVSAAFLLEVSCEALLRYPEQVVKGSDIRDTARPLLVPAMLQAQVSNHGTIAGVIQYELPPGSPVWDESGAHIDFAGPWTLDPDDLEIDYNMTQYRIKLFVVADDAAGTGAVLTPVEVSDAVAEANDLWSQCCIKFLADLDDPGGITYIPAGAFAPGDDLFHVNTEGSLATDEERFLLDYDDDPDAIEVVFTERLVGEDGIPSSAIGVTYSSAYLEAGCIVTTRDAYGNTLAHELGHAILGSAHSTIMGNLMDDISGYDLTEDQCADAATLSPLPRTYGICLTDL